MTPITTVIKANFARTRSGVLIKLESWFVWDFGLILIMDSLQFVSGY